MSTSDDRPPEKPRYEPEIIPPGRDRAPEGPIWVRVEGRGGTQRVYFGRPGLFSILLGLVAFGLVAALVVLLLAGVLLFWIPIIVGGIVLALAWGALRFRWRLLREWWAGRR